MKGHIHIFALILTPVESPYILVCLYTKPCDRKGLYDCVTEELHWSIKIVFRKHIFPFGCVPCQISIVCQKQTYDKSYSAHGDRKYLQNKHTQHDISYMQHRDTCMQWHITLVTLFCLISSQHMSFQLMQGISKVNWSETCLENCYVTYRQVTSLWLHVLKSDIEIEHF